VSVVLVRVTYAWQNRTRGVMLRLKTHCQVDIDYEQQIDMHHVNTWRNVRAPFSRFCLVRPCYAPQRSFVCHMCAMHTVATTTADAAAATF